MRLEKSGRRNRHGARSAKGLGGREYYAANAATQLRNVEGDKQAQMGPRCLQIRDDLGKVNGSPLLDDLELDDELAAHEKIDTRLADRMALAIQAEWHLPSEGDAADVQFDRERLLVDGFEKARTKDTMHFDSSFDYRPCKRIDLLPRFFSSGARGVMAVHFLHIDHDPSPVASPLENRATRD